jgi:protease II
MNEQNTRSAAQHSAACTPDDSPVTSSSLPAVVVQTLSTDGTVALGATAISESGELFAYGLSKSGSDWISIRVRRVSDGHVFDDVLDFCKFTGIAWAHDDSGFFYSRYPAPSSATQDLGTETDANLNQALYWHAIGTPQAQDKLIWSNPAQPKWMTSAGVTDDGEYLCIVIVDSCDPVNRFYYAKISDLKLNEPKVDARDKARALSYSHTLHTSAPVCVCPPLFSPSVEPPFPACLTGPTAVFGCVMAGVVFRW